MFDIPMNTKGAMSADSLLALNNGGMAAQPQMQQSQPMSQPQMQQSQPMAQPQMQPMGQPQM